MIFKIGKSTSCSGMLNYHMEKVERGKGEITYSSFGTEGQTAATYARSLEDIMDANPRVYKNKYLDISANFAPEDKLSKEKKVEVIDKWMEGMGYGKNAYILFHHTDKQHDHYHIVTTSVDLSGKKIAERDNYRRSVAITRALEQEYDMRELPYVSVSSQRDKTEDDYYVSRGLRKAVSSGFKIDGFLKPLGERWRGMSDKEIKQTLMETEGDREGKDSYFSLRSILADIGCVPSKNPKEKMRARVLSCKVEAATIEQFKFSVACEGYYMRSVTIDSYGDQEYIFGKAEEAYTRGDRLDSELSHAQIHHKYNNSEHFPPRITTDDPGSYDEFREQKELRVYGIAALSSMCYANKNDKMQESQKEKMRATLLSCKEETHSMQEFVEAVTRQGYCVRPIAKDITGEREHVFGTSDGEHVRGDRLAAGLSYDELSDKYKRIEQTQEHVYREPILPHTALPNHEDKTDDRDFISRNLNEAMQKGFFFMPGVYIQPFTDKPWHNMDDKEILGCFIEEEGKEKGLSDYLTLRTNLWKMGFRKDTDKEHMRMVLLSCKFKTKTMQEFVSAVEKRGYSVRPVSVDGRGKREHIFGSGEHLHVRGDRLDDSLSYDSICRGHKEAQEKVLVAASKAAWSPAGKASREVAGKQIIENYIALHVSRVLRKCYGISMFESTLAKQGIKVIYAKNSGGTYGVSFSSSFRDVKDYVVKGSTIGHSWNQISYALERNRRVGEFLREHKAGGVSPVRPTPSFHASFFSQGVHTLYAIASQSATAAMQKPNITQEFDASQKKEAAIEEFKKEVAEEQDIREQEMQARREQEIQEKSSNKGMSM